MNHAAEWVMVMLLGLAVGYGPGGSAHAQQTSGRGDLDARVSRFLSDSRGSP